MNIYEKILTAKKKIAEMDLKKTGLNKYSNIQYFELSDILYPILTVCEELKLATIISFTAELATMSIVNIEKPEEKVEITSPMAKASLKGCHDIQNMGAVETYQRRYLYIIAFDIIEADQLDRTFNKHEDNRSLNKNLDEASQQLDNAMKDGKFEDDCKKFLNMFKDRADQYDIDDVMLVESRDLDRAKLNSIIGKFRNKYK